MKKALSLAILLVICGNLSAQKALKEEFEKIWMNAQTYTLEVARAMPEKHYSFSTPSDHLTFAEHFIHISENIEMLYKKATGEPLQEKPDKSELTTKAAIIDYFATTSKLLLERFQGLDEQLLEASTEFGGREMPNITLFYLMRDHMTHHRSQMILYLRMNGIDAPSYRGW